MLVGIFSDETRPSTNLPPSLPTKLIFSRTVVSPKPCCVEPVPEVGAAGATVDIALRDDLQVHPIRQAELEICLANYPGAHAHVGMIDIVFVERPVGDVRFDLENAGVDRVRTVGLAWSIGVVGAAQLDRRGIEQRVSGLVRRRCVRKRFRFHRRAPRQSGESRLQEH